MINFTVRFFIQISYNGSNFSGWQKQPNAKSIQQEINYALSTILNENIEVVGAGRTDAGVHAKKTFAHFDCNNLTNLDTLTFKLNKLLPNSIAIYDIRRVEDNASSRFDAKNRTYSYYIINKKNPLRTNTYLVHKELNIEAMNNACSYILGKQDFTSFSKVNTQTFTNICNVSFAKWKFKNNEMVFTITADRFLRNMVRAVVGTLLDVGTGKIMPVDVKEIISARDRGKSGFSVPAHALFLVDVGYPSHIFL